MEHSNAVPFNPEVQSGQIEQGPFHGGHCLNAYEVRPPPFWGPFPHYHGFAPRGFFPPAGGPYMSAPPNFSVPPPPPSILGSINQAGVTHSKNEDEIWVSNWLKAHPTQKTHNILVQKDVSISEAKEKLKLLIDIMEDLKCKQETLSQGAATLSNDEWKGLLCDVEKLKSLASNIKNSYFCGDSLKALQKSILKRARKRSRLKSQCSKRRKDSYDAQLRRQSLHRKADAWLADMQLAVERARKDEELKKEADLVLSEVTRRQSEGRRQVALLQALQKLHFARVQARDTRGPKLSGEEKLSSEHSISVFKELLELWSKKMEEYATEEQGLRIMLEESAAQKSDLEIQKVHRILGEWETCLFGLESSVTSDGPHDVDTLVSIRYAWDQYLVPDGVLVSMASAIPVGWVLPTTPSSPGWQKLLSRP